MVKRYTSAEKQAHDDLGVKFTMQEGELVYDAATKQGPWATMTRATFEAIGRGVLGLGLGQEYRRQANGELHLVRGDGEAITGEVE